LLAPFKFAASDSGKGGIAIIQA